MQDLTPFSRATYDAANEQTAFAGSTLTYDNNGNLTSDGVNTYQWDVRNRLVSISGGATASFNYDALGRRTNKVINSVASQFLYDGNDIAAEVGGGAIGASYLRSLNIDEPFVRQTSTGNEHYHTDALGSALTLSNSQGSAATTYTYESFGKTTVTGTSGNPFQFTGRENDGTGLHYYRARYYSSRLNRFVSEDPLGINGGDANFYSYVRNSPAVFTDPQGLYVPPIHALISFFAARLEGCSGSFADKVSQADVLTDREFNAFKPGNAHIHGQIPPGSTEGIARNSANTFIDQNLSLGTAEGLGQALHATEDPHALGHRFSPFVTPPSLSLGASNVVYAALYAQYWAFHLAFDIIPIGALDALEQDRQVIRRYKELSGRKNACQ